MKPNARRTPVLATLATLALALLIAAGCRAGGEATTSTPAAEESAEEGASASHAGNFVGEVSETDAFMAMVDTQDRVLAYVCDGDRIAEWFRGQPNEDGTIELSSDGGARLLANVTGEGDEGTVVLPDSQEHAFAAEPATGEARLYRKVKEVNGEELVGGWILLSNGEERGVIKNRSSGFMGEGVELARPSWPVNGFIATGIDI